MNFQKIQEKNGITGHLSHWKSISMIEKITNIVNTNERFQIIFLWISSITDNFLACSK